MGEAKRRKQAGIEGPARQNTPPTMTELFDRCPYITLLGDNLPSSIEQADMSQVMPRVGATIAVLGGEPDPLEPDIIADAIKVVRSGRLVLLMSDRPDLRDRAKRELWAMIGPPEGFARA